MEAASERQEFTFQAEITRLLELLAHSLYQSKDIALRELISNASDALDKMRHISLTDPEQKECGALEIQLLADESQGVLTIVDNGIGMTREELVNNLGTIAHSGSLEFLKQLSENSQKDVSLIGQFGVGFYSAFMVAGVVKVYSRSYREGSGWLWESDGGGAFTVTPTEIPERGTRIVLQLKDDVKEFAKEWRLRNIVQQYSGFVPHPIKINGNLVNEVRPIWLEPKTQVNEEQYKGFYKHLTHHSGEDPLWHLHVGTDSPIQFNAVIYCPPTNVELLGFGRQDHGLHLCARRVLVQSDCKELLPEYLRFLHGLVDSQDLPLNISRETLQDNSVFRKIRSFLVRKVFDRLDQLAEDKPDEYLTFWKQFGVSLKEGVATEASDDNRQRLAKLLRFSSTHTAGESLTTLTDYVRRGPPEQKQIYYIGGPNLAAARRNPHLEAFSKRNLEVLLLTDPIDEFAASALRRFEEKELKSVDAADVEMPPSLIEIPESATSTDPAGGMARLLELFKDALGDKVEQVRLSKRLTDSACCLVNPEGSLSSQMQKLMRMTNRDFVAPKRILELNPTAPLVKQLDQLTANGQHDAFIKSCGQQLYSNAILLEGLMPEPEEMVARVQEFMTKAAEKLSPIILT